MPRMSGNRCRPSRFLLAGQRPRARTVRLQILPLSVSATSSAERLVSCFMARETSTFGKLSLNVLLDAFVQTPPDDTNAPLPKPPGSPTVIGPLYVLPL